MCVCVCVTLDFYLLVAMLIINYKNKVEKRKASNTKYSNFPYRENIQQGFKKLHFSKHGLFRKSYGGKF